MTAPTVPEPYGVEHYADRIRTAVAGGGDLYVYSYALAISLSTSPALPAEVVERLRNIRTAVNLVLEEQLAALSAPHPVDPTGLNYSREPDEVDDPTPVSPARGGQPHVVAMTDGGLVDETPDEVLHMQFVSGDTSCGLTQGEYRDGCGTANQAAVTCKACIDGMPF